MKKSLLLIVFVTAFQAGKSQSEDPVCVKKGTILVDAYYGFPNLYSAIFRTLATTATSNNENLTASGIGPLGLRAEYLVADKVGLGVDFNYSNNSLSFNYFGTNSLGNTETYTYKFNTTAIRAMVGVNWHWIRTEKIDFYGALKTGYYNRTFTESTTDQGVANFSFSSPLPVAFRIEIGVRYFFTENIGIMVNTGLGGGGLVNGGICGKF